MFCIDILDVSHNMDIQGLQEKKWKMLILQFKRDPGLIRQI